MKKLLPIFLLVVAGTFNSKLSAQPESEKVVIAYFSGRPELLDSFDANKMTHIIYCFGHLKGNEYHINSSRDTLTIRKMVAMKQTNPKLKVLLSLGGWGGCKYCSDVFNSAEGRTEFVRSFKKLNDYFGSDGIDLDWEYPAVNGYPGHTFRPEDKDNFTALISQLRQTLGANQTVTFAAGGFQNYIDSAVDWTAVAPLVDYINLMTYDLVNGYSKLTGHHTALYSSANQKESTDNCVKALLDKGVDSRKLIIGGAFYARVWQNVEPGNNGLYKPGTFRNSVDYKRFSTALSANEGFQFYWDDTAKAPYAYSASKNLFATFDDKRSISLKTTYVLDHNLGGIMFWELASDTFRDGLLDAINKTLAENGR